MLRLASSLKKYELPEAELLYWKRLLEPYPAEAIEHAFDEAIKESQFFPDVSVIVDKMNLHCAKRREEHEAAERRADIAQRKQLRLTEGTYGTDDVSRMIAEGHAKADEKRSAEGRQRHEQDRRRSIQAAQVILGYQFIRQLKQNLAQ